MSISMRNLFSRREIPGEIISFRNSLSNHVGGAAIGLREAMERFDKLSNGNGFESGCRRPDSLSLDLGLGSFTIPDIGGVLPSWVPVEPRDHRRLARTLEGILRRSSITNEDFPLRPWHVFYDWNFFVEVDPQYRYLVSPEAVAHNAEKFEKTEEERDIIECEWDTAFLPLWAIPQEGCRVWLTGRWIFDCGHAGVLGHRTEIHPPKAIVSFRSEATHFKGNSRPTRANLAVIYIGRRGGYIEQAINDQNYTFDLYLPPRPHAAAEPKFAITHMTKPLPVDPQVSFFPERDPRLARVVVPLAGVTKELEEYGAIVAAGWSDVDGTEAARVKHFRVKFDRLSGRGAPEPPSDDTWVFFFGVNGRWNKARLTSDESPLNATIELALHEEDSLHVTACGFARRKIDDFIGEPSDVAPRLVSQRITDSEVADGFRRMRDAFLIAIAKHGGRPPTSKDNAALYRFSKVHRPVRPGPFDERAEDNPGLSKQGTNKFDYQIAYTIEEI